jgi:hypothetical protein
MKMPIPRAWLILPPLALGVTAFSQTTGGVDRAGRAFALKLAAGSTHEAALSQLADSGAGSSDVKSFAELMIQDHGGLNAQLPALCQQKGIDISDAVKKGREKGVGPAGGQERGGFRWRRGRPEKSPYGFWRRAPMVFPVRNR